MTAKGYSPDLSKWITPNAFVLNDESVRNLDPNSPLLTLEEKKRIIAEAKTNPSYFAKIICAKKKTA